MPWWDDKLPAQLAGVRFHVDRSSKRGGRRSTAHEFPGVDEAYVEDSGAAPHRYRLEAFLVGPDYHVRLQELEDVLDRVGPLEYQHPDRGIISGLWARVVAVGKVANLVVWDGDDPFELSCWAQEVWIRGRKLDMTTRQTQLRDRYMDLDKFAD